MPATPFRPHFAFALALAIGASDALAISLEVGLAYTGRILDSVPPDTQGAVGADHVVELENGGFSVYDKQDGTEIARTADLDEFWEAAGVDPDGLWSFDPRVLYDPTSERWFAVSVDGAGLGPTGGVGANRILVAVSETSDPTQGWTGFAIDSDATDRSWADFPQVGLDADALYVSASMLGVGGVGAVTNTFVVVPKADLLATAPTASGATSLQRVGTRVSGFVPTPVVDLDGGGLPTHLYSGRLTQFGAIQSSRIDGPVDAPTYTGGGFIMIDPMPEPPYAQQPGPKADIDTGAYEGVFSGGVIRQNGIDWTVQAVEFDGRVALRWIQIDPENDIVLDSGVIADPVLDLFYPSIAVNEFDEIVIGMNGSSESDFVGAYAIAGAKVGGVTTFGDLMLLRPGVADYERLGGGPPRNRWGDYSATVVDPTNPHRFWTFQEYVYAEDTHATWISELIFVPEPGTVALVACGVALLACRRLPTFGPSRVRPSRFSARHRRAAHSPRFS
jgi:hypothetical protein